MILSYVQARHENVVESHQNQDGKQKAPDCNTWRCAIKKTILNSVKGDYFNQMRRKEPHLECRQSVILEVSCLQTASTHSYITRRQLLELNILQNEYTHCILCLSLEVQVYQMGYMYQAPWERRLSTDLHCCHTLCTHNGSHPIQKNKTALTHLIQECFTLQTQAGSKVK